MENIYKIILEETLSGYWDYYIKEDRVVLSPAFKAMFGYLDDELPNTTDTWSTLILDEDIPAWISAWPAILKAADLPLLTSKCAISTKMALSFG